MLEFKKITKIYQTGDFVQTALDNVSVNFRENEFVSILGPSGSGKTTMLNIIGGLDKYTSGDLIINGVSTKDYKDKDWDSYRNHRVGFVFQSYNLISHQSILQNVELALTLSGVDKKERRKKAIRVLERVGLKDHIKKRPNQLSGGQMQRVAIARALINDPDILLADEPTGALDTETSKQIMELLKEIAKNKLVIMVTHNPELANEYSTRIVKVLDGKIIDDSMPFDGEIKKESANLTKKKSKKTSMSFFTALSLSLNNLLTKKGRTILTAFAGSIGIIGIALILSLSNGIQEYIDRTEEETLSSYPLQIQRESLDMSSMITTMMSNQQSKEYNDDKIHSVNIMGDILTSVSQKVKYNDLKSFKKYLEDKEDKVKSYTSDIRYTYDVTLNLYKNDTEKVLRVNPTTIFDSIGMSTSGISSVYDMYMSNYDVFSELNGNERLLKQENELVAGSWPNKYNEVVIMVDKNNQISDYTLYSLGILDPKELEEKFNKMIAGEEINFETTEYDVNELIGLTFKLVLSSDYYKKTNNVWINMSEDENYMKNLLKNSEEIKIVGIIRPSSDSIGVVTSGVVGYTHDLVEYIINKTNEKEIVKQQKEDKEINVFTGRSFSSEEDKQFDYSSLSKEELAYFQSLSQQELAELMKAYADNANATYETNLNKLGVADLDNPSGIMIFPKDFDSKEEIENIINEYNEGKNEEDKITYTDIVGVMMSSVSSIVNVISSVLIAFVAISLVVSSIMIAIITYISVIERTKEIGILRAIGASKKDISRVFNAETLIEGLSAGVMGIIVTLILNIPINIIIENIVNISNISKLPFIGAVLLIIISVILTVVAGFIPAKIASKKDPVEALRTE